MSCGMCVEENTQEPTGVTVPMWFREISRAMTRPFFKFFFFFFKLGSKEIQMQLICGHHRAAWQTPIGIPMELSLVGAYISEEAYTLCSLQKLLRACTLQLKLNN